MTTITLDINPCIPYLGVNWLNNYGEETTDVSSGDTVVMLSDGIADGSTYQGIIELYNVGGGSLTITSISEQSDPDNVFTIGVTTPSLPESLLNDLSKVVIVIEFSGSILANTYTGVFNIVHDGVNAPSPFVLTIEVTVE